MDPQLNLSVKLDNRDVWIDGASSFDRSLLEEALYAFHRKDIDSIFVRELTPDIIAFNRISDTQMTVRDPATVELPVPQWPEEITSIDIYQTVSDALSQYMNDHNEHHNEMEYLGRISTELQMFHERGLDDVLRACIFVVNTLHAHSIVWGVGRGSAVASFVLYLVGVHDVDSVKYNLSIEEFLGENDEGTT